MSTISRTYTFTDGTTAYGSQVETEISGIVTTWNNHDAGTSSFTSPKVAADPTAALGVASKQYVDNYATYRRPVVQYSSGTVANIETGINGTSGQARILFPDGNLRTDSTAGRINCNLAQVAALSGTWQSGLRTGTVVNNTWYAVYAVKTTDDTAKFVAVADTVLPIQANYATLNSNFGTNGWVYLGLIRYGDQSNVANQICEFYMSGNTTIFNNNITGGIAIGQGVLLATSGSSSALGYTYAAGTNGAVLPSYLNLVYYMGIANAGTGQSALRGASGTNYYVQTIGTGNFTAIALVYSQSGAKVTNTSGVAMDICLKGFIDPVLGVGSNPIL